MCESNITKDKMERQKIIKKGIELNNSPKDLFKKMKPESSYYY